MIFVNDTAYVYRSVQSITINIVVLDMYIFGLFKSDKQIKSLYLILYVKNDLDIKFTL